ncbi:interferon-induced 35 kDa protein [Rhinatrema bivittatum]|uniref:interferon-induced 35 kDa protein n=1 Tax=Rhinatrema bivittatum TaxID=194408 RepID=UPI0011270C8C|nr:interferon-induced 35 kDa protein [Rhinatrema bivittatum]
MDVNNWSTEAFVLCNLEDKCSDAHLPMTPEWMQQEIENYKAKYAELQKDKDELENARAEADKTRNELEDRALRLSTSVEDEARVHASLKLGHQIALREAEGETANLLKMKNSLEVQLQDIVEKKRELQEEMKSSSRPERRVVFKGHVQDMELPDCISIKPKIQYPISGGCVLITFEEAEVAQRIIDKGMHDIQLEECRLRVEARPVELLMPSALKVQMQPCHRRILVSNIPDSEKTGALLDKLELFFTKRKNGGGEVEERELLPDSGNVVITFLEDGVGRELAKIGSVNVPLESGKTYPLKVTPYIKGEIRDLKFRPSVCRRTVLLTGIPDIMDQELLQDLLEIHFQKPCNGGGEVDVLSYVPLGRRAVATFEEDASSGGSAVAARSP